MRLAALTGIFLVTALSASTAHAGAFDFGLGIDVQRYPVGTTTSFLIKVPESDVDWSLSRSDFYLDHDEWWVGLGCNRADREDDGEFDEERAEGWGASLAYRRYAKSNRLGWSFGGRVDLWDLNVNWIDAKGLPEERRGQSETLVLQPTAVAGYAWHTGAALAVEANISFGTEINVNTRGPDVGEGPILLGGVSLFWPREK